ncbi:unnamed protein product [Pseudo-nitzschia multistriata]|uniref:Uncharacterized protein n=1 Tax=Pseudo-nitzschia multistriata TaxID=183589 RepID=A0A448Z8E4_9STRA|nr:unnamed protein product [Pseudo-nitzschia multistriata]
MEVAVAIYFIPAQINFVDLELVSDAKSPRSMQAVCRPLMVASRAIPAPVAPPPITKTSKDSPSRAFWRRRICSALEGRPLGAFTSFGSERTLVISRPGSRLADENKERKVRPLFVCFP